MDTYKIPRHKVFVSYHHKNDQHFKDFLANIEEFNPEKHVSQFVFDDYSVKQNNIDDKGLTNEQVRKRIRKEYIRDATVLILLCGVQTKERKFVDWELQAAMYDDSDNPKLGILVINLPTLNGANGVKVGEESEKPIIGVPSKSWTQLKSRAEYEQRFPYLPSRIIDNFEARLNDKRIVPITVVEYNTIKNNKKVLKTLIHNAFRRGRRKGYHYDHSAPLKSRNR